MQQEHPFFIRKKQQIAVHLNEVQQQAVLHTEGPLLLLAAPGSGKTTTLLMRIGYLIEEKGGQPSRIKAITFSRASAGDMKERYKRFFPELPPVDFSTIHSLAFEIVREYFRAERISFQIIEGHGTSQDIEAGGAGDSAAPSLHKKMILRDIFRAVTGEVITDDQLEELTTYISYIKNKMIPESQWGDVSCGVRHAEQILGGYEKFKQEHSSGLLIDLTIC